MREIHTIDERIRATTFAGMIKFYSMLILNGEPERVLPPNHRAKPSVPLQPTNRESYR